MKDHIITGIIGLLTLIIGVLLGYYADIFKEIKKNEIQYVDVETISRKNTLRKISTKEKGEIKLIWNNNEIDAISKISISMYNYSQKDFDNLPLHVAFQPDSAQKIEILNIQGFNEANIEDHTIRKGYPKTNPKGVVTYLIELGVLNRTSSYRPSYTIEFLIKGNDLPEIIASINKKGVKKRVFSYSHLHEKDYFRKLIPFVAILSIIFFYLAILIIVIKYARKRTLRKYARFANDLSSYFLERSHLIKDELKDNINQISVDIVQELRFSTWQNLSKVDKLLNNKPPERKELEDELTKVSS